MTCVYEKNVKRENYKKKNHCMPSIHHSAQQGNIIRSLKSRYGCNYWTSPRRRYGLGAEGGGKRDKK